MDIRFSVVIPAFNASATIVAAVDCCLQQTYAPHEVIVVNDGSTDDTLALLQSRFAGRVMIINLEKNSGPSAARNAGIAAASGTHIAFQDADDIWHKEKLEHLSQVLTKRPDIRFLFHPYTLSSVDFSVEDHMLAPQRYPFLKLLFSNPIGTPCVVMKRSKDIRFKDSLQYMEDYELFLREAWTKGVFRIAAPLTRVGRPILSAGGQSSRRWKMRVGEMCAWLSLTKKHPLFVPALPFLVLFALIKHIVKSFFPPRTNY